MADIRTFDHLYVGLVSYSPVQLSVPNVEGDDAGGSPLEETVREPPGGRADIDRTSPRDRDSERLERCIELLACATDEWFGSCCEMQRV